ncbi:MAG: glycosyltransferase [Desulfatitalea sp.]
MTAAGMHTASGKAWRIAMLSIHSSPTGPLGTRDTGGMSVYVRELSQCLGAAGHQIDIYTCAGDPGAPVALAPNVRLIHVGQGAFARIPKERLPEHMPRLFAAVEAYRREQGLAYDLIHSHYWISGVVGAMAQAQWHRPHLTMFHTLGAAKNTPGSGENESDLRVAQERRLAQSADRIVAPSRGEQANLMGLYGVPREKISVLPCGVDLALFQPRERAASRRRLGLPAEEETILFVGRFAPLKGLENLIQAAALLRPRRPHLTLLIVGGDGPLSPDTRALMHQAHQLGMALAVRFTGRVAQTELPHYYAAADLLALPSYYESFGLVVLEALACGTPVAATAVGVVPDVIQEGRNGTILTGPEPGAVAQGLERLLAMPTGPEAAQNIRRTVEGYGWSTVAADVEKIYSGILSNEKGRTLS